MNQPLRVIFIYIFTYTIKIIYLNIFECTYDIHHIIESNMNIESLTHKPWQKATTSLYHAHRFQFHDVLQVRSCYIAGGLLRQIHQAMFLSYLVAA